MSFKMYKFCHSLLVTIFLIGIVSYTLFATGLGWNGAMAAIGSAAIVLLPLVLQFVLPLGAILPLVVNGIVCVIATIKTIGSPLFPMVLIASVVYVARTVAVARFCMTDPQTSALYDQMIKNGN